MAKLILTLPILASGEGLLTLVSSATLALLFLIISLFYLFKEPFDKKDLWKFLFFISLTIGITVITLTSFDTLIDYLGLTLIHFQWTSK